MRKFMLSVAVFIMAITISFSPQAKTDDSMKSSNANVNLKSIQNSNKDKDKDKSEKYNSDREDVYEGNNKLINTDQMKPIGPIDTGSTSASTTDSGLNVALMSQNLDSGQELFQEPLITINSPDVLESAVLHDANTIPEPSIFALLSLGLIAMQMGCKNKQGKQY